ncbi:MAG: excinuclease ABC subunit UvrC [Candidatus Eisenbacteria sp.]|nr:excinuclease ABC subunit UvrC [Candidatus Eisenbacteria bacterium]
MSDPEKDRDCHPENGRDHRSGKGHDHHSDKGENRHPGKARPPTWRTRLEKKVQLLPRRPGVYLLKDGSGNVLYIGKAKQLPARVRSYFRGTVSDARLQLLREQIRDLDYVVTVTEAEALVLEANLIKAHSPYFNIELKDDKKYPFFKINIAHAFPRLVMTRRVVADGSRYFGPYTRVKGLRQLLRSLRRLFPLRSCTDRRLKQGGRECLKYSIALCPAPCTGKADAERYRQTVEQLVAFLEGRDREVARVWQRQMRELAGEMRFEESARLRDDIERLSQLRERQRMTDFERPDLDAIALIARGNRAVASVLSHQGGKVIGTWRVEIGGARNAEASEIIATVLSEHYQAREVIPPLVLCNVHPRDRGILEHWLGERAGHRVRLHCPQRGRHMQLLQAASENAALALEECELLEQGKRMRLASSAYLIQEALGLPHAPSRIEGFDISNIQGRQAVGSLVVFSNGQPLKSAYRRFRIRQVEGSDDVAMMAEILQRRARRLHDRGEPTPDLMLIDGGKGQVNRAAEVLRQEHLEAIAIVGLAKQQEELFLPGASEPVRLPASSPGLQLLQRVRDEAHRFAVSYHRKLRSRPLRKGPLEEIRGLGRKKLQALLAHFGDLGTMAGASEVQLGEVPGIGPKLAREIRTALQGIRPDAGGSREA